MMITRDLPALLARHSLPIAASLAMVLSGCDPGGSSQEADPPVPTAAPTRAAEAPGNQQSGQPLTESVEKSFEGISLTIPAGWIEQTVTSQFVQAEYQLPGEAGTARMTLSSAGGGVEPNLQRWEGQFQRASSDPAPRKSTVTVDGVEGVVIELQGTFTDGFSGKGPQANWSMLGAIIPTGPANFFLKLTGPRETVAARRDEFMSVVESARLD